VSPAKSLPPSGVNGAVWQGFAGSMLLLLGSFGDGWLASSSSLIRTWLLITARTTSVAAVTCTVLLCVGALLMVRAWLRLGQLLRSWDGDSKRVLTKALVLWVAPMMLTLPLFSRDSYAYIGQGRLMLEGLNPYTNGISALNNYFSLGPDLLWAQAPTPYGPVFLWLEQGAVWMANGSPELALIPFRLASLGGVMLLARYVPKLAAHYGFNPTRALWLTVLNPVLLVNFIGSVHNDSLMLGLVVAGIYYVSVKHPYWGIVFVTASVAIKPITLIALPFIALIWAGSRAGWVRKFALWAVTFVISMGLMAIAGAVNGLGFGWLAALQTPGTVWIWFAPVGLFSQTLGLIINFLGGPGDTVTDVIKTAGQVVAVLLVMVLALVKVRPAAATDYAPDMDESRRYASAVVRRMAWAFAAVVLLAVMIQPWYMIWLLAFFTITGIKDGWQMRMVNYLTVFFILIALTDQLSVFQGISILMVRLVAVGVGLACAAYVMLIDKKTRGLFVPALDNRPVKPAATV
jgi:hypothetical protein